MVNRRGRIARLGVAVAVAALLGLQIGLNVRVFLAEACAENAAMQPAVARARSLERAADFAPFRPDLAHEWGVARLVLGDLNGARYAFERSLRLAPNTVHTLLASAHAEIDSGNLGAARDRVARARVLLPDYWRVAVADAAIDVRAGDLNRAVETLRAALDLPGVERGPVMALLAQTYAALGDSEQALSCVEEAATLRR